MTARVSGLFIQPLKSAGIVSLNKMKIGEYGPEYDRIWAVYGRDKKNNRWQIARQSDRASKNSSLALLRPYIWTRDYLMITTPSQETISFEANSKTKNVIKIHMFHEWDYTPAVDAGDKAAEFFSDYLGGEFRLACLAQSEQRMPDPAWAGAYQWPLSFADGFHTLVINQNSFDDLNFAPEDGMDISRVRANIVVFGWNPWEEDVTSHFGTDNACFRIVKPCGRCPIVNINQSTGAVGKAFLKALQAQRKGAWEDPDGNRSLSGVFFGQNAVPFVRGYLEVGQEVFIRERQPMHPALLETAKHYISPEL